jgi:hypothetical protein
MLSDGSVDRHNVHVNHDDLPLPALLAEARGAFGAVIRHAIAGAGLPPLPRDGAFVLGGLHFNQVPLDDLIVQRSTSIERHETIGRLVASGYLAEKGGELALTERGVNAAVIVGDAVGELYHELGHAVGDEGIATLRAALLALIAIKEDAEDARTHERHLH